MRILVAAVAIAAVLAHVAFSVAGSDVLVRASTRALFVGTVLVELFALRQAMRVAGTFEPGDEGRRTWRLIVASLFARAVAQLRLLTIYFELVPAGPDTTFTLVYVVGLRYLYTASDLLAIAALVSAVAAHHRAGLGLSLRPLDLLIGLAIAALPTLTFLSRSGLDSFLSHPDPAIVTYRLVAVCVSGVVVALSLILLRQASQMGGGALARVWASASWAGLARAASFPAIALVSPWRVASGDAADQLLLWLFAGGWLLAALHQRTLLEED